MDTETPYIPKLKIGNNVKRIREIRRLTQEEMAESLGMSQSNYSKLERDEIEFNISRLIEISQVLNVKPEELLRADESNVFFIQNNETVSGINGTVHHNYNNQLTNQERALYEDKVQLLIEKNEWLQERNRYLEGRLRMLEGTPYVGVNDSGIPEKVPVRKRKAGK